MKMKDIYAFINLMDTMIKDMHAIIPVRRGTEVVRGRTRRCVRRNMAKGFLKANAYNIPLL
jgi:hypothetical protein